MQTMKIFNSPDIVESVYRVPDVYKW